MTHFAKTYHSVPRQLAANVVGRVWVLFSNLIFIPVYLHLLGLQNFGVIALFLAVAGLISFLDMGLSTALARELNDQRHTYLEKLDLLFTYEVVCAVLVGVIMLVIFLIPNGVFHLILSPSDLARPEVAHSIRLVFAAAIAQMLFNFYISGLLGIEEQVKGNVVLLSAGIVRSALVIIPIWLFPTPDVFLMWQLITVVAFTLIARGMLYKLIRKHETDISPSFKIVALLRNFSFTGSVFIISVAAAVNTQIDKIFIGRLAGLDALAAYSLVSTFAQILVFVVTPITITLLPRFVRIVSRGENEGARDLFDVTHRVVAAIVCAGVGSMIWFGPYLISLWTVGKIGPEIVSTYSSTLILGYGLLALSMVPHCIAIAYKNMRGSLIIAFTMFLTVPSYWFFIGRFGPVGAAWTWVVLQAIVVPFYFAWVNRTFVRVDNLPRFLASTVLIPFAVAVTVCFAAYQLFGAAAEVGRNLTVISLAVVISVVSCLILTLRPSDRMILLRSIAR